MEENKKIIQLLEEINLRTKNIMSLLKSLRLKEAGKNKGDK